jgi:hypothetical protein
VSDLRRKKKRKIRSEKRRRTENKNVAKHAYCLDSSKSCSRRFWISSIDEE